MSAIKDGRLPVELGGKERHLLFSLNVIDEELTEKQVGKMIHTGNFAEVKTAIFKAFSLGNNGTEEPPARDDEEDDEEDGGNEGKNAEAGKE